MLDLSAILQPGLAGEVKKTVDLDDTTGTSSPYLGQYLSTSACAALAVHASMAATEGRLPEGYLSVGRRLDLEHDAPAMTGTTVIVKATLREIRGNRLIFDILGSDALGVIFKGVNERVVVNRIGLEERGTERAQQLKALREKL
ncbi:MAG: thioesterase [Synergistaceae bacterium]|jgi:predicted thioesterase|nr:thioesterase [Synergistaceae bacterium]MDD3917812.1 thioesterase [Synergistaceae bacterium]NLD96701.1 thioesterase [Synergistaceae bacterium]HRV98970.1 thioesterase [Aminobacteriaceae bacterium]